jgi:hypothetical protein
MTKPRDPREWDDTMLVHQLVRHLKGTDVRTRDLVYELELRLWSRTFEIEAMNKSAGDMTHQVERLGASIREVADLLGVPRPRPALQVMKGGEDA